jgi:hypothetical protein
MISYLAIIAFAAKSRQMFEHPGKIFPRICVVAMRRTMARVGVLSSAFLVAAI